MDIFRISGGRRLHGRTRIGGAKNAVLPILAACMMTDEKITIRDCPVLTDTRNMLAILETMGCVCTLQQGGAAHIDCASADCHEMPEALSKALRSSIFMMGSLLGRFRRATVTYPGGCEIGMRPIDLHLKGLRALGVKIREAHGMIYCDGQNLHGGEVHLDFPSVGATENVMMAAVLAPGKTVIHNAAREPEIVDLQNFICAMGGRVSGAGRSCVVIDGVDALHGCQFAPIPDRIVAGTFLAAAAATGGEITLENARATDLGAVLDKLTLAGCEIETTEDSISLAAPNRLRAFEISTQPFPGFPTDMQAQFMAMACVADGTSMIVENVFKNRLSHAAQLMRMGADIRVSQSTAIVRGGALTGARVSAKDLRAGAALVVAGLAAEGVTEVDNCAPIDRGYERLEEIVRSLGGQMERV